MPAQSGSRRTRSFARISGVAPTVRSSQLKEAIFATFTGSTTEKYRRDAWIEIVERCQRALMMTWS
jgi:hypothetical protein